jgi:serine/threonine protein kinase
MLSDCFALTESLSGHQILEDAVLSETVKDLAPQFENPSQLAAELVRRGWLTNFQKEMILAGRADELVLGKYVLLDKIGEGGMGAVYKARHRVLKAVRAIKVIRPDRLVGVGAVERFYREAEVVAKLHHPNIILAHDADKHGNVHYFVMEYAPGADLGQLLQRCGPLPAADASAYIRQAALGLEHARERGLIHRDIKPSNLLVTPDGQVKLLDLGLARVCAADEETPSSAPLTQDGAVMGTPDYMAPEQAEDSRKVDIRADIYSLGCTFYHILTGRAPYPGGSVMEKLIKHRLEEPRPLESLRTDLPEELVAVVRKMMAKSRDDRYQTPAEAAAALEPFCEGAGRPQLSLPAELAGTLLPGMIPGLSAGFAVNPTVLPPDGSLPHTDGGVHVDDCSPTAPAIAKGLRGSTERMPLRQPTGLQATELSMPGSPQRGGSITQPGDSMGLQATQMITKGLPSTLPLEPTAPPRARRTALVAALVLLGLGAIAGGAFLAVSLMSPSRPDLQAKKPDVQQVTPPTSRDEQDNQAVTVKPVNDKNPNKTEQPSKPPIVDTPPPGPPPKAIARALTGDRSDLTMLRTRGPSVRTGQRGLSWARRHDLFTLQTAHKGKLAAFSADASRAVLSTMTDALFIYNFQEQQPSGPIALQDLTNLIDGASHVTGLALTPDGSRIVLATVGRSEKPLDGNAVTTRYNMLISIDASGQPGLVYGPPIVQSAAFSCLAFAQDGSDAVVAGLMPQIYRWRPGSNDLRTGRRYFKHGAGDTVNVLSYSTDSRRVASGGMDKNVCVFDATKTTPAPLTTLSGLHSRVVSLAQSERGRFVLAGGQKGTACIWEVTDEPSAIISNPLQTLTWHDKESNVTAVAFASTGRTFVTGSEDGTVCVGEVGKDKPIWIEAPRGGAGAILGLSISADNRRVIVADELGFGEYSLEQDVTAKNKPALANADPDVPLAEAKGP